MERKRIRDSKRPFPETQRAIWEFARSDLADLKEARDNLDEERFYLVMYRQATPACRAQPVPAFGAYGLKGLGDAPLSRYTRLVNNKPPIGLSINAIICVLGFLTMFSAIIVSNIFGGLSLTVICELLSGICLLGLVIACIVLSMSAEMDRKSQ